MSAKSHDGTSVYHGPLTAAEQSVSTDGTHVQKNANVSGRFLDVPGLSQYLGVDPSWVYDRTAPSSTNDRIPHFKMGKYNRFDIQSNAFNEWLNRNFRQ